MISSNEVLGILDITYRQLDYWSNKLLNLRTGSGKQRNFTADEVLQLANIWVLTELGLKPATALDYAGAPVIKGINCLISVDLDQLQQDIDHAVEGRKSLQEAMSERIGEGTS